MNMSVMFWIEKSRRGLSRKRRERQSLYGADFSLVLGCLCHCWRKGPRAFLTTSAEPRFEAQWYIAKLVWIRLWVWFLYQKKLLQWGMEGWMADLLDHWTAASLYRCQHFLCGVNGTLRWYKISIVQGIGCGQHSYIIICNLEMYWITEGLNICLRRHFSTSFWLRMFLSTPLQTHESPHIYDLKVLHGYFGKF